MWERGKRNIVNRQNDERWLGVLDHLALLAVARPLPLLLEEEAAETLLVEVDGVEGEGEAASTV